MFVELVDFDQEFGNLQEVTNFYNIHVVSF